MSNIENKTQIDSLVEQAAAVARFQASGEPEHANEADRLSKISGVEIGPHGEIIPRIDATYVTEVCTDNTGGGCMVDFITLDDGRVLTLNDEAIGVYASKEAFYNEEENESCLHFMWISDQKRHPDILTARVMVGAQASYACIKTDSKVMDIMLTSGKSASDSLLASAQENRIRAERLLNDAMVMEAAAKVI